MKRVRFVLGALLALFWMAPIPAHAQTGTVRGTASDSGTREPLSGVTVTIGDRSALTGSDGHYVLGGVPAGTYTVRARMLGYAPATASATIVGGPGAVVVDFAMSPQAVSLSEIVVTGYGEQKAGDITGAVKQITTEDFNPGTIISPQLLIENKIAGVQIVDNNDVGGGLAIRIRGATSVNASSEPLYVIDGMPVGTGAGGGLSAGRDPLNFLNPNDIESITVLKDASAAAIYGANAANGVVIITTKSRRAGATVRGTQVEYSGTVSSASATRFESVLSASEFRTAVTDHAPGALASLGTASTNWFDQISRAGFGQEHNLVVTGAGQTAGYRLSLGYLKQNGVIKTTSTERMALGFNYDQRLFNDRLDVSTAIKGSRTLDVFQPGGMISNAAQMGPTQPVYDSASTTGFYNWPGAQLTSPDNPLEIANLGISQGVTWRSLGNVQADYQLPFIQGLKLSANLGYDVTKVTSTSFSPSVLHSQLKNGTGGTFYRADNTQINTVGETYLNYNAPLNFMPGNVDLTGGYSYAQSHSEYPSINLTGLSTDLLNIDGIPQANFTTTNLYVVDSKLISFFGRMNYNLNDRYLIAASVRRDGSSRFAKGHEWGVFPSLSLAWRLSQEPFLRDVRSLSDLKIRASWARTGNQAFPDYQQYSTFQTGNSQATVQFGNLFVPTIRPSAVNPNIKWEATSSWNVGLDYGFNNQRFSGAIDWYVKKTSDLIFSVPIPAGTNMSNYLTTNIGNMRNTGIEFSLTAQILRGGPRALGWTADFTASHNANELTQISANGAYKVPVGGIQGGVGQTIEILMAGQPIYSFFVYQQKYGANGRPIYSDTLLNMYVDQPTVLDTIACPRTGTRAPDCVGQYRPDGIINSADLRPFHDPAPKWIFGHTSNFTYGKFDLSFTLRAWTGNYVYNNVASSYGDYSQLTNGSFPYNLDKDVLKTGFLTNQKFSDYYVQDGSFLRMDNITVGYNFRSGGYQMRLFASVQNAFTITGYKGVDPTAGINGIDNNLFPRSRTLTGGLSVRL